MKYIWCVAIDGFNAKEEIANADLTGFFSLNYSGGLGYKYYLPKPEDFYLKFQCSYNYLSYFLPGGIQSDLSGSAISLLLGCGIELPLR